MFTTEKKKNENKKGTNKNKSEEKFLVPSKDRNRLYDMTILFFFPFTINK